MVGFNIGVSVPTLGIAGSTAVNLDETNTHLEHATSRETLPTKLFCDGMVQPIELPDVGRFLVDRQHLGGLHLHAESQLKSLDASRQLHLSLEPFKMDAIEFVHHVQQPALAITGQPSGGT